MAGDQRADTLATARPVIENNGRLDPHKLDVAAKPKRRRRLRNLPEPSAELRAWEGVAEKRMIARPHPPGILLEPAGQDKDTGPRRIAIWLCGPSSLPTHLAPGRAP